MTVAVTASVGTEGAARGGRGIPRPGRLGALPRVDVSTDDASTPAATGTLSRQGAGRRVASLEQTVLALRRQVIQVQEAERQRIARDLHDEAGHALSAAVLRLDLEMMRVGDDSTATEVLKRVRQQLVECSAVLHSIAFNLRPRILEDLGLHAALRSLAAHAMELSALDVTVAISGRAWILDEPEELVILRVVQEALTNVRKHAQARRVRVSLRYGADGLTLQVADDGVGVNAQAAALGGDGERATLGIGGMRERVVLAGGRFSIRHGRAGGTRVVARLPR